MKKILLADDNRTFLTLTSSLLEENDYEVKVALNKNEVYYLLEEEDYDIFLLDLNLPYSYVGMEVLRYSLEKYPELPVVMISGDASIKGALAAIRQGAVDFIEKPVQSDRLLLTIKNVISQKDLEKQIYEVKKQSIKMKGNSLPMQKLFSEIIQVSKSDFPVLILGETGSGKDMVASAIHNLSKRSANELIDFNCSAVPENLWESELFGHRKGSFTGAYENKPGYLELAHKSSIFLDEVSSMPLNVQPKLLRFLETGEMQMVGSRNRKVDVRIISAANEDLEEMVKTGNFREDLLFRLNVLQIEVPPLREHREDIPELVKHFLMMDCSSEGIEYKELNKPAMRILMEHDWKGNVRELKNIIDRSIVYSTGNSIDEEAVKKAFMGKKTAEAKTLKQAAADFEKEFITNSLILHNWNVSKTADDIGIERSNLYKKIRNLEIDIQKNK